jgi:ATP-dependent RNA helicase DeaD
MIKFEQMGFTPGILEAIQKLGFEQPMPVQEKVIPLMLESSGDIIALAQTGTGKTAAFGLPLVQMTDTGIHDTQALVLCPTRELCIQITNDLTDYAKFTGKLRILAVYGGASIETQARELRKGIHIIVATPGRLIDLIGRGVVRLNAVSTVILDEADEMLNMGFLDSINEILEEIPSDRKTLLFSATMSSEIASIAKKYMTDAVEVTIGTRNSGAENVTHGYYLVHAKDKYRVLKRIADFEPDIYGIVFCRTRKDTQEIATKLINDGYNADALHGDLSQGQRDAVMQKFRSRSIQLLVATDVAARGLDVDDITHIINYSLPEDPEVYTHRSGRTGRAGKAGISIMLVHMKDKHTLQQIERLIKKKITAIPVPTGREICGRHLFHWVHKLENVVTDHQQIEKLLPEIHAKLEGIDKDELIRRIVSLEFNRFLEDYRDEQDIEAPVAERHGERRSDFREKYRDREPRDTDGRFTRLFINMGKTDGFYPEQLIELVNKNIPGRKIQLGKIDLLKSFSFFEVESSHSERVINALCKSTFRDRKVSVEIAQPKENPFPSEDFRKEGGFKRESSFSKKNDGGFRKAKRKRTKQF